MTKLCEHKWVETNYLIRAPGQEWGGIPGRWRYCESCNETQEYTTKHVDDDEEFGELVNKGLSLLDCRISIEMVDDDGCNVALSGYVSIDEERVKHLIEIKAAQEKKISETLKNMEQRRIELAQKLLIDKGYDVTRQALVPPQGQNNLNTATITTVTNLSPNQPPIPIVGVQTATITYTVEEHF